MKKILNNKLYMKVLVSDLISNFGDTLYFIALMTYVTEIKSSNLAISIVNISETIPILFTIFFGIIADRTLNKVGMIIKTLWIRTILYLLVAVVMNFKESILVVILASIVNLISDTLGQFENGLFYPISNRIVKKSDREETMAFRQTATSTMNIVNQSLGAFLITFLSFFHLALINSLTFAISLLITLAIKSQINNFYIDKTPSTKVSKVDFKATFSDIAFYYQNIYFIVLTLFLSSVFVSALNPKIGAIIFNNLDETKLATIFGGMVTYFQLGDVVSRLLFSTLVIYLSYTYIAVIYMILVLIVAIYTFRRVQTTS